MRWIHITNLCRLWMRNLWRIPLQPLMLILFLELNHLKKDRKWFNNQLFYKHLILVKNLKCSHRIRMWLTKLTMDHLWVEIKVRETLMQLANQYQLLLKHKLKSYLMLRVETQITGLVRNLIHRTLPNNSLVSIQIWLLLMLVLQESSVKIIKILQLQIYCNS